MTELRPRSISPSAASHRISIPRSLNAPTREQAASGSLMLPSALQASHRICSFLSDSNPIKVGTADFPNLTRDFLARSRLMPSLLRSSMMSSAILSLVLIKNLAGAQASPCGLPVPHSASDVVGSWYLSVFEKSSGCCSVQYEPRGNERDTFGSPPTGSTVVTSEESHAGKAIERIREGSRSAGGIVPPELDNPTGMKKRRRKVLDDQALFSIENQEGNCNGSWIA